MMGGRGVSDVRAQVPMSMFFIIIDGVIDLLWFVVTILAQMSPRTSGS